MAMVMRFRRCSRMRTRGMGVKISRYTSNRKHLRAKSEYLSPIEELWKEGIRMDGFGIKHLKAWNRSVFKYHYF